MRHKIQLAGLSHLIEVDSAGTGEWHIGKQPHAGTRELLEHYRISYEGIRARQFHEHDFQNFTYIVCMDESNERDVRVWKGANEGNSVIFRFMELLPEEQDANVPDPYYTGNFDEVYRLVAAGCDRLLHRILTEQDQLKQNG